jgi:hypothetical protein
MSPTSAISQYLAMWAVSCSLTQFVIGANTTAAAKRGSWVMSHEDMNPP